jgi:meiotically up-regulated gene 157 (Mug157) protein
MATDAGTGFIHESFHKDDPAHFTREWFAWQNTLFGELILKLIDEGKLDLLNSITVNNE